MDLNNLNITLGILLQNQRAKAVLAKEFPTLINTPIVKLYSSMSLKQILSLAKGKVPADKLERIKKELEEI